MGRRVVGQGADAVGPGVVEGGVELGQGGLELFAPRVRSRDRLLALLLMSGERGEALPQLFFGAGHPLQALLGEDDAGLGRGDLLVVFTSPPTAPALVEGGACIPERLFGLLSRPEGIGELPTGVVVFGGPVDRDPGVEAPQVPGRGGASVAELVDPVGERVVCLHAGGDDLGPVVVKLAPQA